MSDNSYNDWISMNDKALSKTIGKFIQHHRLNQNKSQETVATEAGISRSTLSLLERGEKVTLSSLLQVLRILDLLYVMDIFKITEEISPIAYAKLQKNKRKNASGKNVNKNTKEDLGW